MEALQAKQRVTAKPFWHAVTSARERAGGGGWWWWRVVVGGGGVKSKHGGAFVLGCHRLMDDTVRYVSLRARPTSLRPRVPIQGLRPSKCAFEGC